MKAILMGAAAILAVVVILLAAWFACKYGLLSGTECLILGFFFGATIPLPW